MAFLNPGSPARGVPRAEINMIPLIDVMLVLLVIFMVTAPLLTHAVKLDLPRASSQQNQAAPKVDISIDAAGQQPIIIGTYAVAGARGVAGQDGIDRPLERCLIAGR